MNKPLPHSAGFVARVATGLLVLLGGLSLSPIAAALTRAPSITGLSSVATDRPNLRPHAYPNADVGVIGHGWGHGYGMGQYGALGYALAGTPYSGIVAHFYGGTTLSTLPTQESIRVVIQANDGKYPIVTSASAFTVDKFAIPANGAVMIALTGSNYVVYQGSGCGGPWDQTPLETVPVGNTSAYLTAPAVVPAADSPQATQDQLLQLCGVEPNDGNEYLRGEILPGAYNTSPRTVNLLPVEEYLDGVVPSESPAGWGSIGSPGPQGEPWGFQELEAQAIAARSYALSGLGSYGYADICDSTQCQVYLGYGHEDATSSAAVADTAGQVMETSTGAVANTPFSSSTGGYTKGSSFSGGEFAVADGGDAVCIPEACNPNHTWTASIPVSTIESVWPQIGTLQSITVTQRDGHGDFGGRATQVTITGGSGSVSVSGTTFEADFGLNSDFFAFTGTASGGNDGYWLASSQGNVFAYGAAAYSGSAPPALPANVVALTATPSGDGYWLVDTKGNIYPFGDAGNFGSTGSMALARPIVGMAGSPDGKGYWLVASDGGIFTFGDAAFYGSTGAMALNKPIVGMAATPDGAGYWLVASDGGIFTFGDAVYFGSTGSLALVRPVIGMSPTADGHGYWLVASDGGIFTFGDAAFYGSLPGESVLSTATGMAPSADGHGYEVVTANGEVHAFGGAPLFGDLSTPDPGYQGTIAALALRTGS